SGRKPGSLSRSERKQLSERMRLYNLSRGAPSAGTRAKMSASIKASWLFPEAAERKRRLGELARALNSSEAERRRRSEQMSRMHAEGRIPRSRPSRVVVPIWIGPCASGKRRNPDFLYGSGKNRVAILMHGTYWHSRPDSDDTTEMKDYGSAGWRIYAVD